ncbi:MAG: DUF5319 domain-containing protein [Frankiaceae bacterium]|nr:DUF5319 domain-containing protein [Frankiaceae bacterium]MBV9369521.1 DUF5319 domain-containing protein [Frankiales bacterium]
MRDDPPLDPFADDPGDPSAEFGGPELHDDDLEPLTPDEEAEITADLADLEVFQVLLEPRGVRGLVVDCQDCEEPHYFAWDLLRSNLRHLLDEGQARVHEPAFSPDPSEYVSWDYARGFADAMIAADD